MSAVGQARSHTFLGKDLTILYEPSLADTPPQLPTYNSRADLQTKQPKVSRYSKNGNATHKN